MQHEGHTPALHLPSKSGRHVLRVSTGANCEVSWQKLHVALHQPAYGPLPPGAKSVPHCRSPAATSLPHVSAAGAHAPQLKGQDSLIDVSAAKPGPKSSAHLSTASAAVQLQPAAPRRPRPTLATQGCRLARFAAVPPSTCGPRRHAVFNVPGAAVVGGRYQVLSIIQDH